MSDRDLLYRFAVVTLFPEMFAAIEQLGITGLMIAPMEAAPAWS